MREPCTKPSLAIIILKFCSLVGKASFRLCSVDLLDMAGDDSGDDSGAGSGRGTTVAVRRKVNSYFIRLIFTSTLTHSNLTDSETEQ